MKTSIFFTPGKLPLLGIAALLCGATATARSFTEFPSAEEMQTTGGVQVTGISSNGRYIIGSTYMAGGSIYDVQEGRLHLTGASGVADDGTAVAGLYKRNIHTGASAGLKRPAGTSFLMTTGISADGSIVTGTGGPSMVELHPYYWEGDEPHELPFPSTAEVATFKVNGCRANGVSDDGSVIWGNFIASPNTNPLIFWERQPDGSYSYVDVWSDIYEPQHGWVYDYDRGEYDFVRGPNPYCRLEPLAMSGDGRLILIRAQENTEEESPANKIGIFHVDSRSLELAPWSTDDPVGKARNFDSRGIANDGSVAGIAVENNLSDAVPFIMRPGSAPVYLNDAFPEFDRLWDYADCSYRGLPYLLTVISADARYVAGYSTDVLVYEQEDGTSGTDFGFYGYVIDTLDPGSSDAAVDCTATEAEGEPEYFTVSGLRLDSPVKGVNIVRHPDGTTRKMVLP